MWSAAQKNVNEVHLCPSLTFFLLTHFNLNKHIRQYTLKTHSAPFILMFHTHTTEKKLLLIRSCILFPFLRKKNKIILDPLTNFSQATSLCCHGVQMSSQNVNMKLCHNRNDHVWPYCGSTFFLLHMKHQNTLNGSAAAACYDQQLNKRKGLLAEESRPMYLHLLLLNIIIIIYILTKSRTWWVAIEQLMSPV